MSKYVIGDIHGNYQGLLECLMKAKFCYEHDILIQLGDIVDGGAESYACVEELLKIKQLIPIKGNHDAWLEEFCLTGFHPVHWKFGALNTARSYAQRAGKILHQKATSQGFKVSLNPDDVPEYHQSFFKSQLSYYIDEQNNCFVHGGFDSKQPLLSQRNEIFYWDRILWKEALRWSVKKQYDYQTEDFNTMNNFNRIFIGHTSTLHWGITVPMKAANIYNIDTGSGTMGKLTIMDVDTLQFWQSGTDSCLI